MDGVFLHSAYLHHRYGDFDGLAPLFDLSLAEDQTYAYARCIRIALTATSSRSVYKVGRA
jgi:hypothetical protein